MTKLTFAKPAAAIILSSVLILVPARFSPAQGQTTPSVAFRLSPSVFPVGQSSSALLCMSPANTAGTLMFDQNDIIGFNFDNSIGIVTAVSSPISVHSEMLS